MSQYILRYEGFARVPAVCHVVVATDEQRRTAVLIGELEDNPGTSVINAVEQVAETVSDKLLHGRTDFAVYQFAVIPIPDPERPRPTFYKVTWNGGRAFTMPTWDVVDPAADPWLGHLQTTVSVPDYNDYTVAGLMSDPDRKLLFIDAVEDPPPWDTRSESAAEGAG